MNIRVLYVLLQRFCEFLNPHMQTSWYNIYKKNEENKAVQQK